MRNILKVLLVVAFAIPTMASANLASSKHNLSTSGTGSVKTNFAGDACRFCHLVHNAQTTSALWGRNTPASTAAFGAGNTTLAGTPLPTVLSSATLRCMSCHDGTVAMNVVTNKNGVNDTLGSFTANANVSAAGMLLAPSLAYFGTGLSGQHPVQIPYAGQTGGAPASGYNPATATGCLGGAVNCVSGTTDGVNVKLFGTAGALTVECASCHEPHSDTNGFFLRVPTAANRCIACHIK